MARKFKFFSIKENIFSKQSLFFLMAGFLLVILIGVFIFNLSFLFGSFNEALKNNAEPPAVIKFDIEGFEKLKLIK